MRRIGSKAIGSVAGATLALVIALGLGGCEVDETGSYPATNRADCLPQVTLVDQHGNRVSLDALRGKPVLIDFVYTSCTSTCPLLTQKVRAVAQLLGPALGTKAEIVSISIDPEHDGPAQLLNYARRENADDGGWLFLTGAPAQIEQVLAIYGLRRDRESDGSIAHMTAAFLLGPDGRQVRQYDGLAVDAKTVLYDIGRAARPG